MRVLVLGALAIMFASACKRERPEPHAAAVPALPAITEVSPQVVEASVRRGLSFLGRDRSDLSALVVLDYLHRKYGLPSDFAFEATHPGGGDDDKLRTWGRFVGDDRLRDVSLLGRLRGDPSVEEVVMHTLYCDRSPLPPTFVAQLKRFAQRGDYQNTHGVLALKLASDNECPLDPTLVDGLKATLRAGLQEIARRMPADARFEALDVRYEALAVYEDFLGERDAPTSAIARLLAEQQPDGGWKPAADQSSRPHPTVMAVWALLARLQPDAPSIHFARH